jgi:hypothetical protein
LSAPIPAEVKVDVGEVLKTSIKNPVIAIKIIMFFAVVSVEIITTYFVAQSSPLILAIPTSMLAIVIILCTGIALMYFDIIYVPGKRRG